MTVTLLLCTSRNDPETCNSYKCSTYMKVGSNNKLVLWYVIEKKYIAFV